MNYTSIFSMTRINFSLVVGFLIGRQIIAPMHLLNNRLAINWQKMLHQTFLRFFAMITNFRIGICDHFCLGMSGVTLHTFYITPGDNSLTEVLVCLKLWKSTSGKLFFLIRSSNSSPMILDSMGLPLSNIMTKPKS